MKYLRGWARETFPPIIAFVSMDLLLTIVFFTLSAPSTHIGTLRPASTILPKLLELAAIGTALGLVSTLLFKHVDLTVITLSAAFTVLLDLDHLPALFGISQPIRPAHSLAFLGLTLVVLTFAARKKIRPVVLLIFISAFLGHMAADDGIFALYAPFSFQYTTIDAIRVPLAVGAVAFAVLAGYVKSRKLHVEKQKLLVSV